MAENRRTTKRTAPKTKLVEVPAEDAYGHVQPQALEFEEAVLGALMIEKDAYSQISEILKPESFYDHRHQLIFEAIRSSDCSLAYCFAVSAASRIICCCSSVSPFMNSSLTMSDIRCGR